MAFKLGLDCKTYRQTSGTRAAWPGSGAAPNLDLIDNIRGETLNFSKTTADVTTRGGGGWRQVVAALKEGSIDFEMVYDTADADFVAVQAAFMDNTVIAMAFLDGLAATVGTKGLWADFMVTGMEQTRDLEGAVMAKFTIQTTYSAVAPAIVTTA